MGLYGTDGVEISAKALAQCEYSIATFTNAYEPVRHIGYSKYVNKDRNVFLRGQAPLHP